MYSYLKLIHAYVNNFQSCVSYLLRYIQTSNFPRVIYGSNMGSDYFQQSMSNTEHYTTVNLYRPNVPQ
jgi:hypothetical protein